MSLAETPEKVESLRMVRFGTFRLHQPTGELYRGGEKLPLRPQSFLVLRALLERPGEVVSRQELIALIWPEDDVFVEYDLGLNAIVRRLREVLGDDAKDPAFVETLPRQGYRFIASVAAETEPMEVPPSSQPPVAAGSRGCRSRPRLGSDPCRGPSG